MTPEEFVKGFYLERKSLIDLYLKSDKQTDVGQLIASLSLDVEKSERLRQILNSVLRDAFYTVLLGLDGEAQIGTKQVPYKILDEDGNEMTGGDIEAYSWEYFHNNKFEIEQGQADFIATLKYRTTDQGGRKTTTMSGYRTPIKFSFAEMPTTGSQRFIDRELVFPGDTVDAEISIISVDYFKNMLREGMEFEFSEGSRIVGTGKIKHIINSRLKALP